MLRRPQPASLAEGAGRRAARLPVPPRIPTVSAAAAKTGDHSASSPSNASSEKRPGSVRASAMATVA